jgi:CubicO group peptidase (beta-lactamase class C family)
MTKIACLLAAAAFSLSADDLDTLIEAKMGQHQIPGMSVAVVQGGRVETVRGYGMASLELDVKASAETLYPLYSVSKLFSGVAAALLVEEGKLSLDAPVNRFLPAPAPAWEQVKVRHLLAHSSGIRNMFMTPAWGAIPEAKRDSMTVEELIAFAAKQELGFQPGEKSAYSSTGLSLMGVVVEKVAGVSYQEFLRSRIFEPAGMKAIRFGDARRVVEGRSRVYIRNEGVLGAHLTYKFGNWDAPSAGYNSSATDLARFFAALQRNEILPREAQEKLWRRAKLNDGSEAMFGMAWAVHDAGGKRRSGHEGGGAAWALHYPDDALTVIVLTNLNGARADEIPEAVAALYLRGK